MKKVIYIVLLFIPALISFNSLAKQPGTYVRKQLKPAFFIPEKDLDTQERLPSFDRNEEKQEVYQRKKVVIKENNREKINNDFDDKSQAELPKPFDVSNVEPTDYIDFKSIGLDQMPMYKEKYNDYIEDLKVIAKTGETPENDVLKADLSKMNSDDRFFID